ncbi:hypothetical protein GCM10009122_42380 [Fulvivirga kasyanovii]|uniref:DUF4262 domain-containing protein n=1 Tax=Fulvivirga kasyanovii TaxID=396812 RepID=A0ABW9RJD5_9BACT|nr:DUF4262 domain-containing protein [Fulvivirga kasyanovii]MTI24182.1 DUF4262 domain-containing protein [Fulvivirga kasyanovii]
MTSEEKIVSDIKSYGWHIISVFEGSESYQFSYTIGLYRTYNVPELVISGLPREISCSILSHIVEDIKSGKRVGANMKSADYIEGYSCYFGLVDKPKYAEYFGKALWYYNGDNFPMLQCVWPNSDNLFPWETKMVFNQDILFNN